MSALRKAKAKVQPQPATIRKGMLAKVHIAKDQLGLADADYRAMLAELFGVESSRDLSVPQLAKLLNHLLDRGWKGPGGGARPQGFMEIDDADPNAGQKRYILTLWTALGFEPAKLDARCKRQFKVEKFVWLRKQADLQILSKDLWNRCVRRGIDPRDARPAESR